MWGINDIISFNWNEEDCVTESQLSEIAKFIDVHCVCTVVLSDVYVIYTVVYVGAVMKYHCFVADDDPLMFES